MVSTLPTSHAKRSKVEDLKEKSNYLRDPVLSELQLDTTHFSENAAQILKFHGSYQQDNRDNQIKGQEKDYQFMLRTRTPGGYVYFRENRLQGDQREGSGDFCDRVGFAALQDYVANYTPAERSEKQRLRHRANLRPDVFERLKQTAHTEGRTLAEIASDVIDAYLTQSQS